MFDQEVKRDAGKLRLTLVPRQIIRDIAKVREFGVQKYPDRDSWKRVEIERYRDAAFRHFLAYLDDPQGADEENCKDCKYFEYNSVAMVDGIPLAHEICSRWGDGCKTKEDGYCFLFEQQGEDKE